MVNEAARELGRKGGQAKSAAKTAAVRKNAAKPRGKWMTAIAYELDGVEKFKAFGVVLTSGRPPSGEEKNHDWLCDKVRKHGLGLQNVEVFQFLNLASSSYKFCAAS